MRPVSGLKSAADRPLPDQMILTDDTFHRLAHWLAEVSAEAASDPETAVGVSDRKRTTRSRTAEAPR